MTGFKEDLKTHFTRDAKQNDTSMAFKFLRELASFLHATPFYMDMMNETTDVSNCEQVMVFLRWVSEEMKNLWAYIL